MRLVCPLCADADDVAVSRRPGGGWDYTCVRTQSHPAGKPFSWTFGGGTLVGVATAIADGGPRPTAVYSDALLQPEQITTLEQVQGRLRTKRASFEEWLECVHVAEVAREWNVLEQCARHALAAAVGRPFTGPRLREAAEVVVRARLATANNLVALEAALRSSKDEIDRVIEQPLLTEKLRQALEERRELVAQMLLLISDASPACLVQLARSLRDMGRSEQAIICTSHALKEGPDNPVVLTSQGAAPLDIGALTEAHQALSKAHRLAPSVYTERTLSRSCRLRGDFETAVEHAWSAARREPSAFAARLLACAAVTAGDQDAMEAAGAMSAQFPEGVQDSAHAHRQVQLVAARQFVRDKEYAAAIVVLDALLKERSWRAAEELLRTASWHLEVQQRAES